MNSEAFFALIALVLPEPIAVVIAGVTVILVFLVVIAMTLKIFNFYPD